MDGIGSASIGHQILHYRVVRRVGAGGMGVVFQAVDLKLDRAVALKFLPPQLCYDERLKERLEREAKAASALDHNNIGSIYGLEETADGQMFIVMAFYEGEALSAKIQRGPITMNEAINIAVQIGHGLTEAHRKGVIHRDIKPSNVILTNQGLVKIVDFGLARLATGAGLTQSGTLLGTAAYMSPEQAQGQSSDERTDLWALGVVLYEMLSGRRPFVGESIVSELNAVIHQPVPPLGISVPMPLNGIVQRALRKEATERYQSAAEMTQDLEALAKSLSAAQDIPTISISGAGWAGGALERRRKWIRMAGWAAILLLAIGAVIWFTTGRHELESRKSHGPVSRRVVVLPFTNIGRDASNDALCDGLADVLTSRLTSLERLQDSLSVVPASEVRRSKVSSAQDARREFQANLVVEGSVQRDTSGVWLNIDLVDPKEVRQVGSAIFHEPSDELSAIEDSAVSKLAGLLEVNVKLEAIHAVSADGPNVPAAYESYLKGVGLMQRYDSPDNLDKAIGYLQQTTKIDSNFALAYAKLGEAYWLKYKSIDKDPKLLEQARDKTNRALALDDELASAYVTRGSLDDGVGHHELAVRAFERALQLDERNPEAYQGLGRAYESLGRVKEAEEMLKKAIDLDPDSWDGYSRLGTFYFRQARYPEAIAAFRRVVQLVPDEPLGYSNLGGALLQASKTQEAVAMFRKSIQLAPSYVAYANLGTIYYKDRSYADAARMYEKALAINDKDYDVLANLADCYERLSGNSAKTREAYGRAARITEQYLQSNSQDPEAICVLAAAEVHLGQKEEAERSARRAVTLTPGNPDIEVSAAEIFELAGLRDEALELVRSALQHGARQEQITNDPDFQKLRNDPRFATVVAQRKQNDATQ